MVSKRNSGAQSPASADLWLTLYRVYTAVSYAASDVRASIVGSSPQQIAFVPLWSHVSRPRIAVSVLY